MNDKFLERLERLEKALGELKSDYLQQQAPAPKTAPPPEPEHKDGKTVFIKAPPLHEIDAEKLKTVIKLEPEKSTAPKTVPPPLPPAPESDFNGRTLHIKAPPPHEIEAEKLKTVIKLGPEKSTAPKTAPPPLPPAPECNDPKTIEIKAPPVAEAEPKENTPAFQSPMEWFVGRRLFGTLGMLLVLIGICYGVVYAYRTFNFSPEMRVGAACVLSLVISISGFFLRHPKYRFLSLLLKGGGMGGLYIAIFAGFQFYGFFGVPLTGGALAAIAMLVLALSWYEKSQVAGVFATIGAFMMPVLVKTPNPNHVFFCCYLLVINLPVILLGLQRKWQMLYNLSFVFSMLLGLGWTFGFHNSQPNIILTFWTLFTVEYLILALIKLRGEFDIFRIPDYCRILFLMSVNLGVINIFESSINKGNWFIYAAILYGAAAGLAYWLNRKFFGEFMVFLGGAAVFLAFAVPEIFMLPYERYLAWAVESLALGVFAFFVKDRGINRLGTAMAIVPWVAIHSDYLQSEAVFRTSLFFNKVNVLGKIGLLMLLIQGGLGVWRFEKSVGSKIVILAASFGLLLITTVNAGYYYNWHEPWLLFTAFPLAVASLIYCWAGHLVPRYKFLSLASVAWFACIVFSAIHTGNGPRYAWELSLWAPGVLALYWLLPRGNPFRVFATVVCVAAVVKCFHFQNLHNYTGFFNLPFLIALLSGAVFLALNWTPPWLRDKEDMLEPAYRQLRPHLTALGVIGVSVIFCINFYLLRARYTEEYFLLTIVGSLLGGGCVLAAIMRRLRSRLFALYAALVMFVVFMIGFYDLFEVGFTAGAFLAGKLYIWLALLGGCWSILKLSDKVLNGRELAFMRIISGTLFIFIIYREFGRMADPNFARAFSLIYLMVTAILICGWGLWKRRPAARYYSFVLLAIAVIQLIAQSLWVMKDPARIVAFIALGFGLLLLSFVYHKVSEFIDAQDRGELENDKED